VYLGLGNAETGRVRLGIASVFKDDPAWKRLQKLLPYSHCSHSGGLTGILGNVLNQAGQPLGRKQSLTLGGLDALADSLLGGGLIPIGCKGVHFEKVGTP
jgi:hypothetical protein